MASSPPILQVEGLTLSTPPLNNISFSVQPGQIVGIVGPNGAGKTTLLRALAGIQNWQAGTISFQGKRLQQWPRKERARQIAYVSQHHAATDDVSVRDVIVLGRIPYLGALGPKQGDWDIVQRAAVTTGVEHLLQRPFNRLSGGEQQRVHIARALCSEPTLLLLDEPTNHLDINYQLQVLALVKQAQTTTIMVLHDLNLAAQYCDTILLLVNGSITADGSPNMVLTEQTVAKSFHVDAQVLSLAEKRIHLVFNHALEGGK